MGEEEEEEEEEETPAAGRPNVDLEALKVFLNDPDVQSYTPELIFIQPGQPLFHYTDLGGLQGIIEKQDLWLTHSRYSNDDEEMVHGQRAAEEVLEEKRAASESDLDLTAYLDRLAELIKTPSPEGVYICCFCQTDNLLSQWRSYGANGTGVSIQIDPERFSYVTGPDSPHGGLMRLWKVFYEPSSQSALIGKIIHIGFDKNNFIEKTPQDRARYTADAIQFFIPTFKNQDFREESECRLIFTPPPDCQVKPKFRVARGMLVPYFSLKELSSGAFPDGRLPITGVRIGPSANKILNVESARMLLKQAGYEDVTPNSSNTPYRG